MIKFIILFTLLLIINYPIDAEDKQKDDVVVRICRSNPEYSFCKQYISGDMGEPSMIPFPHYNEPKEGEKKKILIIKNEFNPDGTVKIPENITLDASNERELSKVRNVDHAMFKWENNWGFEQAPELKPGSKLLPEPKSS